MYYLAADSFCQKALLCSCITFKVLVLFVLVHCHVVITETLEENGDSNVSKNVRSVFLHWTVTVSRLSHTHTHLYNPNLIILTLSQFSYS